MKTLKVFMLLCIIAVFAFNPIKAQPPVIKGEYTYDMTGQYIPCTDDYLTGFVTVEYKIMPNLYMEKPFKVYITGTSGKVYELSQIYVSNSFPFNGKEITDVSTAIVKLDGKVIGKLHWTYHLTINANGEVTVEKFDVGWDCK
ncbi:MAG: hypothetical protein JXC36_07605 [Candidatus Atribacteria bacterium]|nr:hypothetical protein [Candidatus Atribacteria bacterium]